MSNSKRPHAPKEEKRGAQEIQLSHLDNRFSCQIDGTVIQNVKDYSLVQSSNGKALLNLTIRQADEPLYQAVIPYIAAAPGSLTVPRGCFCLACFDALRRIST